MLRTLLICFCITLAACSSEVPQVRYKEVPGDCPTEPMAKFVIECATAANPHSDEEGEDLVAQCEDTATRIYCTEERALHVWNGVIWLPCDDINETRPKEFAACQSVQKGEQEKPANNGEG